MDLFMYTCRPVQPPLLGGRKMNSLKKALGMNNTAAVKLESIRMATNSNWIFIHLKN